MEFLIYDPFTENHTFLINNFKENMTIFNNVTKRIIDIDNNEKDKRTYIIFINHMFLIENKKAQEDYQKLIKKKNKILYITEPIELIIEINFYKKIINELKPRKVFTYCEENLLKLNLLCKYQKIYPINKKYLSFIDINGPLYNKKDLTKIVFIGKMNDYRNKIKDIFGDDLIIFEDKYKKDEWIEILTKYQYFINIHRRPNSKCFEMMRIIPLLYNNATIISEHVNKKEEEEFQNKNIYFCEIEEMKNKFDEIKKSNFSEIVSTYNNLSFSKYYNMELFFKN